MLGGMLLQFHAGVQIGVPEMMALWYPTIVVPVSTSGPLLQHPHGFLHSSLLVRRCPHLTTQCCTCHTCGTHLLLQALCSTLHQLH